MDTKFLLGAGLLGFWLLRQTMGSSSQGRFFRLPSGQVVSENQLPQFGYVRYQGVWVPASYLNQATQGGNYSAADWQNFINQGFDFAQQGINIWQQLEDIFGSQWDDAIIDPFVDGQTAWV